MTGKEVLTHEEHEDICSKNTNGLLIKLEEIIKGMKALNNRLYVDNGTRSIQSVLNDHAMELNLMRSDIDKLSNTMKWLARTVLAAVIVTLISVLFTIYTRTLYPEQQPSVVVVTKDQLSK